MTKKPKKKSFRITGPSLYRTRDGEIVAIKEVCNGMWVGFQLGESDASSWKPNGRWLDHGIFPYDLISRWPGKKARRK